MLSVCIEPSGKACSLLHLRARALGKAEEPDLIRLVFNYIHFDLCPGVFGSSKPLSNRIVSQMSSTHVDIIYMMRQCKRPRSDYYIIVRSCKLDPVALSDHVRISDDKALMVKLMISVCYGMSYVRSI